MNRLIEEWCEVSSVNGSGAAELQPRPITEAQWADAVEAYQRAKPSAR